MERYSGVGTHTIHEREQVLQLHVIQAENLYSNRMMIGDPQSFIYLNTSKGSVACQIGMLLLPIITACLIARSFRTTLSFKTPLLS